MPSYRVNIGEAVHGGRRFRPKGKLVSYEEPTLENPVERSKGGSGMAARIFVGLNVGTRKVYSLDDIIDVVRQIRKKQERSASASILGQKGIYEDDQGRLIVEPSAQVIIVDFASVGKRQFTKEMIKLGKALRKKLRQESVIVEIQRRGLVVDTYTVT